MKKYYFDYAAATPVSEQVQSAMQPYFTDNFYNPSAMYLAAQSIRRDIVSARESIAKILGAKPSEIIFTAGGTEADNLAVQGVMRAFPEANCVVSSIEHDAILEPAKQFECKLAPVLLDGRVDEDKLQKLIDDKTVLLSIMYANNEIGTIQPLANIAKMVRQVRTKRQATGNKLPLYFHTDACQAANYLPLLVNSLGVDLMTLNGGKIYGPKQSGVLFIRSGVILKAQIKGGGQERNLRSGTENIPGLIGFAAALRETAELRNYEQKRLHDLQIKFISDLAKLFPSVKINGSLKHRLPNNVHLSVPGADNERLMMELDERGIMVATGSACSASSDEPSHVLSAIGLSKAESRSSIRITFGRQTNISSLQALTDALRALV
jgi:cysteine desulfurase